MNAAAFVVVAACSLRVDRVRGMWLAMSAAAFVAAASVRSSLPGRRHLLAMRTAAFVAAAGLACGGAAARPLRVVDADAAGLACGGAAPTVAAPPGVASARQGSAWSGRPAALTFAVVPAAALPGAAAFRAAAAGGAGRVTAATDVVVGGGRAVSVPEVVGGGFAPLPANGGSGTVASAPVGVPGRFRERRQSGFRSAGWANLAGTIRPRRSCEPRRPGFRSAGWANEIRRQPAAARAPVERTVLLMGTWATLMVQAPDRPAGLRRLERMVGRIERVEASLSTWRADSVLSALNRRPVNEPFALPPALCGLWPRLARWRCLTGGAFDPAVGRLVEAWGLRTGGAVPAPDALRAAHAASGFARFRFDAEACRVTRTADATLDAGAFGKGEALRRLAADSSDGPPWLVDFGGQIAVGGAPAEGGWPVALAHPSRRHQAVLDLTLATGSLATSGASERSSAVEGRRLAHILDPRSGRPVHRAESVTVWHEDPLTADILSTALYVLGADDGLDFAERHGLAAVFLVPDPAAGAARLTVRASPAFRARFPAVAGGPA